MTQELTREIAYQALADFFLHKPFVMFGTGTSCAIDSGFGMGALQNHLLAEIPKESLSTTQQQQWDALVSNLHQGRDLESSMDVVQDEELTQMIVKHTASCVGALDKEYALKILTCETEWPATKLFKRLVDGLPETDRKLHVATTNYDLLAEYALESVQIPYLTGFHGGIVRRLHWKEAGRCMTYVETVSNGRRVREQHKETKHIRLYKVHGSLNTFKSGSTLVENNAWIYDSPRGNYERMMITPGTAKYSRLHQNRSELLGEYDQAIEKHHAFLFIGFGFNDHQLINDAVKRKLKEQNCHGLIITRDSNPRIEEYVQSCKNLWLVCKPAGDNREGTRIYHSSYMNALEITDKKLWNVAEFTREILGG